MDVRNLPIDELSDSHQLLRFIVTDTFPAFTNSLRRIIISHVPTIAIEEVIMVENTLALFDEYIAHRLGLIPLASDVDDIVPMDECDNCGGAGCQYCTVSLHLTRESNKDTEMIVYSGDLDPEDPRVYPVNPDIPIMNMHGDQRLILQAIARFGTGKEHAKFQPASSVGYQYMPIIEISPSHKFSKEVAEACPKGVLGYDDNTSSINIINPLKCNLCMECVEASDDRDAIKIKGDEAQIIFLVESNGSLPVENIITKAADILIEKTEAFIEGFQLALQEAEDDPRLRRKVSTIERIQKDMPDEV